VALLVPLVPPGDPRKTRNVAELVTVAVRSARYRHSTVIYAPEDQRWNPLVLTFRSPVSPLRLLVCSALWLVACQDDDETAASAETATTSGISREHARPATRRDPKFCGVRRSAGYPDVEVMEGNVTCREARRVIEAHYTPGYRYPPTSTPEFRLLLSWSCVGPEGSVECVKKSGCDQGRIRANFSS
jgi:hypothetical protein